MTSDRARKKWLNRLLFVLVLIAVGWYLYDNVGELSGTDLRFRGGFLLLGFTCSIAGYVINMVIWHRLADSFGLRAAFLPTARAWVLSRLGRYVPGKVLLLYIRMNLYRGLPRKNVALATVTEYLASLAASCLILIAAVVSFPSGLAAHVALIAAACLVVFAALLHPRTMGRIVNRLLERFNRKPIESLPPYGILVRYVLACLLPVMFHGLAFFFLLNSLGEVPFRYFIPVTGVYYGAALLGMAAFFTPSGIGVREGLMFLVLPSMIARSTVIVGAIAVRIMATSSELMLAGVLSLLARNRQGIQPGSKGAYRKEGPADG